MKKKIIFILLMLTIQLSCYNDLNDLIYEFSELNEPICVILGSSLNGTGRGWAQAKSTIQGAIDIASSGDEIWIAGDTVLSSSLTITKSVSLYGGFNGTEKKRNEAKGMTRITLTGLLTNVNSVPEILLSRMIISNGNLGIGVISIGGSTNAVISGCCFENNGMVNNSNALISIQGTASLIISNSDFINNANSYGQIYSNSTNVIKISNCNFIGNSAGSNGAGAVSCVLGSLFISQNCNFIGNTAIHGGAIGFTGNELNISDNCRFEGNSTSRGGGGAIAANQCRLLISDNCEFINNYSQLDTNNEGGGTISVSNSNIEIKGYCKFIGNYSNVADSLFGGGVIYAFFNTPKSFIISDNCLFEGNYTSHSGGAIYIRDEVPVNIEFSESSFLNNSALKGGAIYRFSNSEINLNNCTFSGNTPNDID